MNCPSEEALQTFVLGLQPQDDGPAIADHLAGCPRCREQAEQMQSLSQALAETHRLFAVGHAEARNRLMALLEERPVAHAQKVRRFPLHLNSRSLIMRRISFGLAAALLVGLVVGVAWLMQPLSALAQVAKELRQAASYQCRVTFLLDGKEQSESGMWLWATPGSLRQETLVDGKVKSVEIHPAGKEGLNIDRDKKTLFVIPAMQGKSSPLVMLEGLARFSGNADRDLGKQQIEGKEAQGFQVAIQKLDPDIRGDGLLSVWSDPASKRPVRIEFEMPQGGHKRVMRFEQFTWDVAITNEFDTTRPAGYADVTPKPPTTEEITKLIEKSLKTFAKYGGGKYPQSRLIYGDSTSEEMFKNAGLTGPGVRAGTDADWKNPAYVECNAAIHGLSWINEIQRNNADSAYYGKTVSPADKDKVLFRWHLGGGEYLVIFGDLRHQTVTLAKLNELEAK
jgi:hypothetical protein